VKSIFITATNTDVGKTYATIKLLKKLANKGYKVGVFKPIETGVDTIPKDAKILLETCQKYNHNFKDMQPADITAYTFKLPSAPFCATDTTIDIKLIIDKYQQLSQLCDILLIEGAGGLLVPITIDYMMIDLALEFKSKVFLVTPTTLGSINNTLLSMEALNNRDIEFSWCINLYHNKDNFHKVTKPFYDKRFKDWYFLEDGVDNFVKNLEN
jgi:dethiobiotin synthetase